MPNLSKIIEKPISGEWGVEGDSISVIRTTNFTNEGKIDFSNVVKRNIDRKKIEAKRLRDGDIIIEKSGGGPTQPVGRVVIFENNSGEFLCNNFTSILRPRKALVFPKYLLYILLANHKYGMTNAFQNKTTGIINLKLPNYLEKTQIPLPPLPVQQKIAAILDAADLHRQKTKTLIEKYDQLTQSIFLEMFGNPVKNEKGWEKVKFGDFVVDIKAGSSYGGEQSSMLKDNELGVLKVSAVTWGIFNPNEFKVVEKSQVRSNIISPKKGDLLFSRANTKELVGATCIVDADYPKLFLPDKIWRIDLDEKFLLKEYVHFLFSNKLFKGILTRNATGTSGSMLNISMKKLKDIEIQLPPISLQLQFEQNINSIEFQRKQVKMSLEKSNDLFNTLLQRAFKGELVS
jgi:type I restriction enzyme, S subunit